MTKKEQRADKYGCDGCCYSPYQMCLRVETCPETRLSEFISTVMATFAVFLLPIAGIIMAVWIAVWMILNFV